MKLVPFTQPMWNSFNGAEAWDDGTPPHYAEHSYGFEEDFLVVVDKNGLEVHFMKAHEEVSMGLKTDQLEKNALLFFAESIGGHLAGLRYQEEGVAFLRRLGAFTY